MEGIAALQKRDYRAGKTVILHFLARRFRSFGYIIIFEPKWTGVHGIWLAFLQTWTPRRVRTSKRGSHLLLDWLLQRSARHPAKSAPVELLFFFRCMLVSLANCAHLTLHWRNKRLSSTHGSKKGPLLEGRQNVSMGTSNIFEIAKIAKTPVKLVRVNGVGTGTSKLDSFSTITNLYTKCIIRNSLCNSRPLMWDTPHTFSLVKKLLLSRNFRGLYDTVP